MKTGSELFDDWAGRYDESLASGSTSVSFERYDEVLDEALQQACAVPGMSVLDLGTGTGNLAARFIEAGCDVWETDFSGHMLVKAHPKLSSLHAVLADLGAETWPESLARRFDRIV
jgi:ubiquinone/menaquinone biosynthesis C-methylase UbiE